MSHYTCPDEGLIDNAAGASQSHELLEDKILRGAVQLNCIDPLRKRIKELEEQLAKRNDENIQAVRDTFESDAIKAWKKENAELREKLKQMFSRLKVCDPKDPYHFGEDFDESGRMKL